MIEFLELVNEVGKVVKKHSPTYQVLPSKEAKFIEHGYDSLDCLMLYIYVAEIYGVPDDVSEKLFPPTVAELETAVLEHGTRIPSDLAAVMEELK